MAQLAIKGHATRGKEVIELLEMLGGNNIHKHEGYNSRSMYCVNDPYNNHIICSDGRRDSIVFTLEGFIKKFPYKIGDKVLINADINDVHTIKSMIWDADLDRVVYKIEEIDVIMDGHSDTGFWYAGELERYLEQKEETMEGQKTIPPYMDYDVKTEENMKHEGTLVKIDLTKEVSEAKEVEVILGDYTFVLKDGKANFIKTCGAL